MHGYPLGIVIPAFKIDFLYDTLMSLLKQTNRDFKVYICDDGGPDELRLIVNEFRSGLDISYKKFAKNLGKISLVRQWNRCVQMTSEPFVCLFSDDDVMEPECISHFYKNLEMTQGRFDVFRFNNAVIDKNGRLVAYNSQEAKVKRNVDFLLDRLEFRRMTFVSEYIFKREAYEREQGFVDFPLGWYSDVASWILFSSYTGIYTIKGPIVYWRLSDRNICGSQDYSGDDKLTATILFKEWLQGLLDGEIPHRQKWDIDYVRGRIDNWFFRSCHYLGFEHLSLARIVKIIKDIEPLLNTSMLSVFYRLLPLNRRWRDVNRYFPVVKGFIHKFSRENSY